MQTFTDFCEWAGSQRQAAVLLKVHESTISRACKDGPSIELARAAQEASEGKFEAAQLLGLSPARDEAA
jgi:DNA-binding transcriptional regulator YdaS (Cro superfamily)